MRTRLRAGPFVLVAGLLGCGDGEPRCVDAAVLWSDGDVRCVAGDLVIHQRTAEALAVLGDLEEITGSLVVFANPDLAELPAMPNLTRLGGSLSIVNNPALATLGGFPALETLGGGILVADNPALQSLTLGPKFAELDSLDITANPQLRTVDGLSGITRVTRYLRVVRNDALTQLGLPALTEVGGGIRITDDAALADIDLSALRTIGGALSLSRVGRLESLTGLGALSEVGGDVELRGDPALADLEWTARSAQGFTVESNASLTRIRADSVEELRTLTIRGNDRLSSIEGFSGLKTLGGLHIADNPVLQTLAEIPGPETIRYSLQIRGNPQLVAPSRWFANLRQVDDRLWILENSSLDPAAVEALVARVEVHGLLKVGDNGGEDTALDPCPWAGDGFCDAGWHTELCLADPEDCGA